MIATDCPNCGRRYVVTPGAVDMCGDCVEDPELGRAIAASGDYGVDPETED